MCDSIARICVRYEHARLGEYFVGLAFRVDPNRLEVMLRESW